MDKMKVERQNTGGGKPKWGGMPENEETQVVEGRVTQRKVYLKKWKPTISYQFKKKKKK